MMTVKLELDNINDDVIQKLQEALNKNKGKTHFAINMYLSKENIFIPFTCDGFQVKYSEKFKKEINKIGIKEYFLN